MTEHNEFGWAYGVLFNDLGACGCGKFRARLELLKAVLAIMPLYDKTDEYLDTPSGEWFLSILTHADLIEHGTSIGGSWITEKGERFLKSLEDLDAFENYIDFNGFCECETCNPKEN